jgi:hypothetical protein
MIANKKKFGTGLLLMVAFCVVLVAMFMPFFDGKNGLQFMDDLYNSISKGSANYIAKARADAEQFGGQQISVTLKMKSAEQAEQTARLFNAAGALVNTDDATLKISGDSGQILFTSLDDAKLMYENNGEAIRTKYGYDERRVLYNWWTANEALVADLNKQEQFKMAKAVTTVNTKAIETAYNYYGIQAQNISERLGIVIFSLVFYVIYTLWYGFGIMYLFEGWGMRLEH